MTTIDLNTPARNALKTPRAAAIAGIIFSVLLSISLVLIAMSVPKDPESVGAWLETGSSTVSLALNLVPIAGIAFLWFIGVIRDRLGTREDKLFATAFFGSGLLFLAMLYFSAAVVGGIIMMYGSDPKAFIGSEVYAFGRAITYQLTHTYTMRMAGLFMMSTCTLSIRTDILPRWLSILGYVLAVTLLLGGGLGSGILLVFPAWIFVVRVFILQSNLRSKSDI